MDAHRKLLAWQHRMTLVVVIYRVTKSFPAGERFGLTSQLRRASVSAAANIAEGHARRGGKELRHFLSIALGSLAELDTELIVARKVKYLTRPVYDELQRQRTTASKTVFGLFQKPGRAARG
jgi:four helix bundle protein